MKCVLSVGGVRWVAPNATLAGRIIDLLGECERVDSKYLYPCPEGGPNEALFPAPADSYSHTTRLDPVSRFLPVADAAEAAALDDVRQANVAAIQAKEGGVS